MTKLITKTEFQLPSLTTNVLPALANLTTALGIPRSVLASDEEIKYAWNDLPRELKEIPDEIKQENGELIARMCVAVSSGLFDGAMNYIWNAAILQLRYKIKQFGLNVVAQILARDFEEKQLLELQDSRLLELCLKLNIIDEDGFFFLDQCREVRNNFSAAHPTIGAVNDREFTVFLNRCIKHALADSSSPKGVDIGAFISAVKGQRFKDQQCKIWIERLNKTHDAQRKMLVIMVHGIYCDSSTAEHARLNSLDICKGLKETINASIKSGLINAHSEYVAKGKEEKQLASSQFFEKLGFLGILNESEQHVVFSKAIDRLWNVHNSMNNFYNEQPFAERLYEISKQSPVPETIQEQFVQTVAACRSGNGYGVAESAVEFYDQIIKGFSPLEIAILIKSAMDKDSFLGFRLYKKSSCRAKFKTLLQLIDVASVPTSVKSGYDKLIR